MAYILGLPEDEAKHTRYCDSMVNEPPVGPLSGAHVIWTSGDDRIILVSDSSPLEQKKLAHTVSTCANREMCYDGGIYRHYDPPDERQIQIFLYIHASCAVGMLLIERRTTIWHCTWNGNDTPVCVEQPEISSLWSIGFVWAHKQYRRARIAYTLFEEARRALGLGKNDIGWYTPFSDDGKAFVRKLYPTHLFVAK
jgi:hypothetical protein